jgi:acetolactate synthase small subunit
MDIQEVGCGRGMDWIELTQDRDKLQAILKEVKTFGCREMRAIS